MGLARTCMRELERVSDATCVEGRRRGYTTGQHFPGGTCSNFLMPPHPRSYKAYFVDLFVRCSNTVAIRMYSKLGYSVYR
jgi:ribosomal protein S18 acetylase RimI-like enzyme